MTRPNAILALRSALQRRFVGDPGLLALLGGPRLYDEVPRGLTPPYVVFGEARADDWSSGDRTGARQMLALHVWSAQGGDSEALGVASALAALATGPGLALDGHVLVLLRVLALETARPAASGPAAGLRRVVLRLQALTQEA